MSAIGVCIEPFFTDLPISRRIEKIAALGFKKYEFWSFRPFPSGEPDMEAKNPEEIAALNVKLGLETTDILYSPEYKGKRASLTRREDKNIWLDNFATAVEWARKIHCPAFIVADAKNLTDRSRDLALLSIFDTLSALAGEAEKAGMTLLLEPLNSKRDHPDSFLTDPQVCVDIIKASGSARIKLLYDMYHMQIMGGNILSFVKENLPYIGHFHIAGIPGRHDPLEGELNYAHILKEIRAMGYPGCFGLEYWARGNHEASLKHTLAYLS